MIWVLVCIPIIYFFFPFFAQSFGIFEQLRLTFAHRFELIYSIMFAPYKQVGGLLFGMVFLTASSAVRRSEIKVSLLITAAGVILLFGSNIVNGLAVLVSPPFGIVAISYMGLASFLLLTGLMVFTKYTAKDIVIRKELHKSINNDAHLLKNLSLAEIERDIAVKVKPLMEKSINAEKEAYEYDIAEGDIKEILQEVPFRNYMKNKRIHRFYNDNMKSTQVKTQYFFESTFIVCQFRDRVKCQIRPINSRMFTNSVQLR